MNGTMELPLLEERGSSRDRLPQELLGGVASTGDGRASEKREAMYHELPMVTECGEWVH